MLYIEYSHVTNSNSVDALSNIVNNEIVNNILLEVVCRSVEMGDDGIIGYVALSTPLKPICKWLVGLVEEKDRDIFEKIVIKLFQME